MRSSQTNLAPCLQQNRLHGNQRVINVTHQDGVFLKPDITAADDAINNILFESNENVCYKGAKQQNTVMKEYFAANGLINFNYNSSKTSTESLFKNPQKNNKFVLNKFKSYGMNEKNVAHLRN